MSRMFVVNYFQRRKNADAAGFVLALNNMFSLIRGRDDGESPEGDSSLLPLSTRCCQRSAVWTEPSLISVCFVLLVFFYSEIFERSYWNSIPAFPQEVLPTPLVGAAFHYRR